MYHISTISDILRQGVDSLAQWLEHWISTRAVRVRIPSETWDFFQAMHHLLVTNFHIRKIVKTVRQHENDMSSYINTVDDRINNIVKGIK